MIAVKCPRCDQVWHSKVKPTGRARLCPDCLDALKQQRRRRPGPIDAFLIATAGVVFVGLALILAMGLRGGIFGWATLAYGMGLSIPSLLVLLIYRRARSWGLGGTETDLRLIRWPVMTGLTGAACVLAYYALAFLAWQAQYPRGQAAATSREPPPGMALPPGFRSGPPGAGPPSPARVPPATELPGLLGYWSFDDDSQAPRVADQSGKGHHATARGATWTEGVRGKALAFNGAGAALDYGTSADFNFAAGAPFTLACWLKTRAPAAVVCGQRSSSDDGAGVSLWLERGLPCGTARQDRAPSSSQVTGRRPVNDGAWHHLALTRDAGGTIELFLDGAAQGQATAPGMDGPITTDLRAVGMEPRWAFQGRDTFQGVRTYLDGAIDEFCLFGRQLTAEDIRTLAGR